MCTKHDFSALQFAYELRFITILWSGSGKCSIENNFEHTHNVESV